MKHTLTLIINELFQVSLAAYVALLLANQLTHNFISMVFPPNMLLYVVMPAGILSVLLQSQSNTAESALNMSKLYRYTVSIGGGLIVFQQTKVLGDAAIVAALITSVSIGILLYFIHVHETV